MIDENCVLALHERDDSLRRAYTRDVGIVVIGRNEGMRLARCLESVADASDFIVYVDSGSIDGSADYARANNAIVVMLDQDQPFTAARARNAGFEAIIEARPDTQFVQFVDGDCELNAGWIGAACDFLMNNPNVAIACGRRRERFPERTIYNQLCDIEWNTPVGQAQLCGGDFLVGVTAFASVGGFCSELIAGEEPELCVRLRELGWMIWRLDQEMTRHDAAINRFGQWWSRSVRCGHAMTEVSRLHWHAVSSIWKWETARAVAVGGLLPCLIAAASLLSPFALIALLFYPLQVWRIALRMINHCPIPWSYATFVTMARFPEFQGALQYYFGRLLGRQNRLIEYK